MPAKPEDTGISGSVFTIAMVLIVVAVGLIVWAAIPGPDARHHFVSPSGKIALDLGEVCRDTGCERVIVSETTATDGSKTRLGCIVPLTDRRPVLVNAYPLWTDNERQVDIVYADSEGVGGKFTLDLAADCAYTGE